MRTLALCGILCLAAAPAAAQAPSQRPSQAPAPPAAQPQATVDPERLAAAREVAAAAQGDRAAVLAAMKTPMVAMMQQMGLRQADRAQILVDEVVMPTLAEHYDELISIQALAFAAVLSKADLVSVAAFYRTEAGRNLAKAQPQIAQALLVGIRQWMAAMTPELQRRIAAAAQAHGWASDQGGTGTRPKSN